MLSHGEGFSYMHRWVRRLVLGMVLLAGSSAFIMLMFQVNAYQHIWVLAGAVAIAGTALLSRGIVREGWHYPVRLLLSVRMRLTIWYVVVLAVVLSVFATGIYYAQRTSLEDDLNKQLDTRLQQVAASYDPQTGLLVYSPIDGVVAPPENLPGKASLDKFPNREIVLLLTLDGTVIQQPTRHLDGRNLGQVVQYVLRQNGRGGINSDGVYPPVQMTLSFDGPQGAIVDSLYSVTSMRIVRPQQSEALLVVGILNDVPGQLDMLQSALLTLGPLVLLIAAIGGFWLAGLSMRPVQTITQTAQQISESDLTRRLKLRRRDELGKLADTFDHMLDRLEAAFTRQAQFTADASHELRTPLTIVNLETNRLLAEPQLSPEQRQSLITIQQENTAMARLIHGLLLLARADAAPISIRHEQVDLDEVVLDVVERTASLARQNRLHVIVAPLPDLTIRGDRVYLVQMLSNIVENALKYGALGGGTCVQIALEPYQKEGHSWAMLRVQDDGPGIPEEHLPHLFERFYRVDASRTHNNNTAGNQDELDACETTGASYLADEGYEHDLPSPGIHTGGSGLGLAIVQWIALAHGGKVQVHSQLGAGATFEVLLPLD
jgi:two-component system, OmpR family, sensor kinase